MDKDDIIKLAREAELEWNGYWEFDMNRFETFANLVAAAEREACAKVCLSEWSTLGQIDAGGVFAAAIRARGNT